MSMGIHPTAIIEPGARMADDVVVGPYAYIGGLVVIGSGTQVGHHATVVGRTCMGSGNVIHPYAYIGGCTHDLKYVGGAPGLRIGNNNVFREFCTVHVATKADDETTIGNNNVFLAYSHIAHDCVVQNSTIMSSLAALGGHVILQDFCNIGWNAGIHQFCKIGKYAMVGAASKVTQDILPYMLSEGTPARVRAPNIINLQRHNFSEEQIRQIKKIFKNFYLKDLNRTQALSCLKEDGISSDLYEEFEQFINSSSRGLA